MARYVGLGTQQDAFSKTNMVVQSRAQSRSQEWRSWSRNQKSKQEPGTKAGTRNQAEVRKQKPKQRPGTGSQSRNQASQEVLRSLTTCQNWGNTPLRLTYRQGWVWLWNFPELRSVGWAWLGTSQSWCLQAGCVTWRVSWSWGMQVPPPPPPLRP